MESETPVSVMQQVLPTPLFSAAFHVSVQDSKMTLSNSLLNLTFPLPAHNPASKVRMRAKIANYEDHRSRIRDAAY